MATAAGTLCSETTATAPSPSSRPGRSSLTQTLTIAEPLGLQILGKTADRVDLQLTAHAGISWNLSNSLHLHNLGETCPDTSGHWQFMLSGTNTSRTIFPDLRQPLVASQSFASIFQKWPD